MKSFDIKIDDEPYWFANEGIVLGDSISEPGVPQQLGSVVIENFAGGLGPKLNRGNTYYNSDRIFTALDSQLILNTEVTVSSPHTLADAAGIVYTPGVYMHTLVDGLIYIGYRRVLYRKASVGGAFTNVTTSDCTAAPISNSSARYTGGAFVWRDRIYFGIEDSVTGEALGYAWVDKATPNAATVVADAVKGFSHGASARGRLFTARNSLAPGVLKLKWSPDMASDYTDAAFTLHGDSGTFVYGIESRPRVSWVGMIGSSALFFLADGSVLASDEAGFIGIISGRSQSSGTHSPIQGFGAIPYLDGMVYPLTIGGPAHINPVTLVTRSLSVGALQDIVATHSILGNEPFRLTAVGEYLIMAGNRDIWTVVFTNGSPVVHKAIDLTVLAGSGASNPVVGLSYANGTLAAIIHNVNDNTFTTVFLLFPPQTINSANAVAGSMQGWIEPGILVGPDKASHMTKHRPSSRGRCAITEYNSNYCSFLTKQSIHCLTSGAA